MVSLMSVKLLMSQKTFLPSIMPQVGKSIWFTWLNDAMAT